MKPHVFNTTTPIVRSRLFIIIARTLNGANSFDLPDKTELSILKIQKTNVFIHAYVISIRASNFPLGRLKYLRG